MSGVSTSIATLATLSLACSFFLPYELPSTGPERLLACSFSVINFISLAVVSIASAISRARLKVSLSSNRRRFCM